ncbi:MAG: hypothetical protein ACRYHQ_26070 [Janthinobacterium lividum]
MPVMKQEATRDLALRMAAEALVETKAVSCNAAAAGPRPQAAETRRLYAADWGAFAVWCAQKRQAALPAAPASVATYLTSLSTTLGLGALARRSAAIADRHRRAGHASPAADPAVRAALRAARIVGDRKKATSARPRVRAAVGPAQVARAATRCPGDLAGLRDRALLLLTAAGLSGERLLALDREHVQLNSHQVSLSLTGLDGGAGETLVLARGTSWATCPVRALDQWLQSSDTRFGPVFRKVDRWGNVEHRRLRIDALRRIWKRRTAVARTGRGSRSAAAGP